MKRLTMSLDDDLADAFDALVRGRGYENRSEAFRDLLRADLGEQRRRAPALLGAGQPFVHGQHLHDLEADGEARVQAGHRLLEDHGDSVAAQPAHLGVV